MTARVDLRLRRLGNAMSVACTRQVTTSKVPTVNRVENLLTNGRADALCSMRSRITHSRGRYVGESRPTGRIWTSVCIHEVVACIGVAALVKGGRQHMTPSTGSCTNITRRTLENVCATV